MPEFMCEKVFGALKPIDPIGEAYLKKIPLGTVAKVTASLPRNAAFHRKYMALLNLGFLNQDRYLDFDEWRKAVAIEARFHDDLVMFDGTIERVAKSIAFHNMDELEFGRLYEVSVQKIAEFLRTSSDSVNDRVIREVEQFSGVGTI